MFGIMGFLCWYNEDCLVVKLMSRDKANVLFYWYAETRLMMGGISWKEVRS